MVGRRNAQKLFRQRQPRLRRKRQFALAPPRQHQPPVQGRRLYFRNAELAGVEGVAERPGQQGDAHAQPYQGGNKIPLAAAAADARLKTGLGAGVEYKLVQGEGVIVKDEFAGVQLAQLHRAASLPGRVVGREQAQRRFEQGHGFEFGPDIRHAR